MEIRGIIWLLIVLFGIGLMLRGANNLSKSFEKGRGIGGGLFLAIAGAVMFGMSGEITELISPMFSGMESMKIPDMPKFDFDFDKIFGGDK